MSGELVAGKARLPQAMNADDVKELPLSTTTSAVLVELVAGGGGGPLPFASLKGSGELVGAAIATFGYAADVPNALATDHIGYLRNAGTLKVKIGIDVETGANTFVTQPITLTLWRKHAGVWAATPAVITYNAGVDGQQQATFNEAFVDGDAWDLRADSAGAVGDVGKLFPFSLAIDFF